MSLLSIEHLQVLDLWTLQADAERTLDDIAGAVAPTQHLDVSTSVHALVLQGYLNERREHGRKPRYVPTAEGLRAMCQT